VDGAYSTYGDIRNVYKILVGKSEGKRQHGKPRCRSGDYKEIVCEAVDWIHLAQDVGHCRALVNMVMIFGECANQLSDYQLFKKDPDP
jgi:hypothetical protein